MPKPVFPAAARERMAAAVSKSLRDWLRSASEDADSSGEAEPSVSFPLHPPTAKQASLDPQAATDFIRAWEQEFSSPGDGPARSWDVEWARRSWSSQGLGVQNVPVRVSAVGRDAIIAAGGRSAVQEWENARASLQILESAAVPEASALGPFRDAALSRLSLWKDWPAEDLSRLGAVAAWFIDNPDSGLAPRAVAVRGIHGKWLEEHRAAVSLIVSGLRGASDGSLGNLGLAAADRPIRIRRLDPELRGSEGLEDISVTPSEADTLWRSPDKPYPKVVLVVENLATFLALPRCAAGSGRAAVWGEGYRAARIAQVGWLRRSDVIYWGDLDEDGFAILNAFRMALPDDVGVRSLMMDAATVERWADLGTPDPARTFRNLPCLSPEEETARRRLVKAGNLRIEQERIPWDAVLEELRAAGFLEGRTG